MIEKLEIENFKAFSEPIMLDFIDKRNSILVFGENGSGKTSLYDALKVVFFKEQMESSATVFTPEETEVNYKAFWEKYNNSLNNVEFSIKINSIDYKSFERDKYQVYMTSNKELDIKDSINLKKLLKSNFLTITDIDNFCLSKFKEIQDEVNQCLIDFKENIEIKIDEQDDFNTTIKDKKRNIERKKEIKHYFNEAKLNLIVLLLLFSVIKNISESSEKEYKVLILDDFVTSLDLANKTFIIKYIFDKFDDFQIFIFTHNINFYNLIRYFINDIYKKQDNWLSANTYEINNVNKVYIKETSIETVENIKDRYKENPEEINSIGNRIRQKFEILLHELSKILMIGGVEESKKIIENIENKETIYLKGKKDANDLIDELNGVLDLKNPRDLQNCLLKKIDKYRIDDFSFLQDIIRSLKLYQKVALHPMSHGTVGEREISKKEIEQSLDLLEKLEKNLKDIVNQ